MKLCILVFRFITDISLYMPNRDNLLNMDGIMFPDEEGTNIFIPSTFILNQMENQGM